MGDNKQINILVCDDDREIVDAIEIYLRPEGYNIIKAYDGREAVAVMESEPVHLVIMDVMMPNMDGISATATIREQYNVPIIILSAKAEDTDKILGLNTGADDYVSKPFNAMELVARVRSQLRRYTQLGNMAGRDETGVYTTGGLMIDDAKKQVTVDGIEVDKLTPIQYNILLFLTRNKGQVFTTDQIYENIWNDEAVNTENTVAVHIRRIREKIEIDPKNPRYLKVVWGLGYKVESLGDRSK